MEEVRLLVDIIEDYDDESNIISGRHRLLVIDKNLINIRDSLKMYSAEHEKIKQRMEICEKRLKIIDDDIATYEKLKDTMEEKIADFIETLDSAGDLPIEYDADLELLIDLRVENYTNLLAKHGELNSKKKFIQLNSNAIERNIESQESNLKSQKHITSKYKKWISELKQKETELTADITAIEDDILEMIKESCDVSEEAIHDLKHRLDYTHEVLDRKIDLLKHIKTTIENFQMEYDMGAHKEEELLDFIGSLQNDKVTVNLQLEELSLKMEDLSYKYKRIDRQVRVLIGIQENKNIVDKCREFYNIYETIVKEKTHVTRLFDLYTEKNLTYMFRVASLETSQRDLNDQRNDLVEDLVDLLNVANLN